jgi:hypothetical protein
MRADTRRGRVKGLVGLAAFRRGEKIGLVYAIQSLCGPMSGKAARATALLTLLRHAGWPHTSWLAFTPRQEASRTNAEGSRARAAYKPQWRPPRAPACPCGSSRASSSARISRVLRAPRGASLIGRLFGGGSSLRRQASLGLSRHCGGEPTLARRARTRASRVATRVCTPRHPARCRAPAAVSPSLLL